jgi:hypothetical protein
VGSRDNKDKGKKIEVWSDYDEALRNSGKVTKKMKTAM